MLDYFPLFIYLVTSLFMFSIYSKAGSESDNFLENGIFHLNFQNLLAQIFSCYLLTFF